MRNGLGPEATARFVGNYTQKEWIKAKGPPVRINDEV